MSPRRNIPKQSTKKILYHSSMSDHQVIILHKPHTRLNLHQEVPSLVQTSPKQYQSHLLVTLPDNIQINAWPSDPANFKLLELDLKWPVPLFRKDSPIDDLKFLYHTQQDPSSHFFIDHQKIASLNSLVPNTTSSAKFWVIVLLLEFNHDSQKEEHLISSSLRYVTKKPIFQPEIRIKFQNAQRLRFHPNINKYYHYP